MTVENISPDPVMLPGMQIRDLEAFIIERSKPVNDCFIVDVRCMRGDKNNVLHGGKRARSPREARLLERLVELINSWMVRRRSFHVPSVEEIGDFIINEAESGAMDAIYVDKRCVRGNPSASGRSRHAREKALLRQVLSIARSFQEHRRLMLPASSL